MVLPCKIANDIDDVIAPDHGVPVIDESFVVLLNAAIRAVAMLYHICVTKMRIGCKENAHVILLIDVMYWFAKYIMCSIICNIEYIKIGIDDEIT